VLALIAPPYATRRITRATVAAVAAAADRVRSGEARERRERAMLVIAVGAVVLAIALFVLITYNRLVRMRFACDNSWAQIEVALKLRHDLVPNLVAAVSGYAVASRAAGAAAPGSHGRSGRGPGVVSGFPTPATERN
jgi:LemA family protein